MHDAKIIGFVYYCSIEIQLTAAMRQNRSKLIGVFFAGMALMNFPLLGLLSREYRVLGLPGLYCSIFLLWLGLILLTRHYSDPGRGLPSKPGKTPEP